MRRSLRKNSGSTAMVSCISSKTGKEQQVSLFLCCRWKRTNDWLWDDPEWWKGFCSNDILNHWRSLFPRWTTIFLVQSIGSNPVEVFCHSDGFWSHLFFLSARSNLRGNLCLLIVVFQRICPDGGNRDSVEWSVGRDLEEKHFSLNDNDSSVKGVDTISIVRNVLFGQMMLKIN